MRKGLIRVLSIAGAMVMNGAAWGQCEVEQLLSDGGVGMVSVVGNVAVVGNSQAFGSLGAAYVYRRGPDGPADWTLEAILMAPQPDEEDAFATIIAMNTDLIAVGAFYADAPESQSGAVHLYRYDGDQWWFETTLTASDGDTADLFGFSLSIDDDALVIGARNDENDGLPLSGSAYVFRYDPKIGKWIEEAKLTDPEGEGSDVFGASVAIRGDVALVGAHGNDDFGSNSGAAFLFRRTTDETRQWRLEERLTAFDGAASDWFGKAVCLAEDVAVVAAPQDDSQNGSAYLYRYVANDWVFEEKLIASDPAGPFPLFGTSLSINIDATTILIGASHDAARGSQSGAAYVFDFDGGQWYERIKLTASDGAGGGQFGSSVALSQDIGLIRGGGKGYIFAGLQSTDCNDNGEPDACDIFNGKSSDENNNGIPDECESPPCPWDLDDSGTVGATDLLSLLVSWGPCKGCPADFDDNGSVGATDLLALLVNWGPCP